MAGYLAYPADDDPDYWIARILDAIAERVPGWTPGGEGTLEVAIAEAVGQVIAELFTLVGDVSAEAVRRLGQSLFGVTFLAATPATISVRVSANAQGVTIPAGFTVTGTTVDGASVAFRLPADSKMASNAASKTVTLAATRAGSFGNGVPMGPLTIATSTPSITTVVAETGPSSGGSDAEADDDYLDRLVASLSTLTRTPILPADFAKRAQDVPGVYRAVALDGYDPATGATNVERTITVVAVDASGLSVGSTVNAAIVTLLDGLREANFVVKTTSPTYTAVNVTFVAKALPGFLAADVQAAIAARVATYLSPASWAGGAEDPPVWRDERTVYYLDLAAELDRVTGVDRITSLTLNGTAGDFTMPGPAGLPSSASTVSGMVTS